MDDLPDTNALPLEADRLKELEKTCFIIMPFGKKNVGEREIDFDAIFDDLFKPAVSEVKTPENEAMKARRTDKDAFSGAITQEMFEYLMYSRLAFGDISGFNANVLYEIGVRHAVQESGTVLFRQTGHDIPFDINTIKVFEYAHQAEKLDSTRTFITDVISETLRRNRLDSPVRLALRAQWGGLPRTGEMGASESEAQSPTLVRQSATVGEFDISRKRIVEEFMRDAQEAIRLGDYDMARIHYLGALRFDRTNIIARMRLGILFKNQGKHYDALEEFVTVTRLRPDYGEAWKEKGVALGLIARAIPQEVRKKKLKWLPDGYDVLKRGTQLVPDDFDAWASLGGLLKNVRGDVSTAQLMYEHAADISDGHPYPLLNAIKEQARATGKLNLSAALQEKLKKAKNFRQAQAQATPPTDSPWCFFDLAEIALYQGNSSGFLKQLELGIKASIELKATWQIETCQNTLKGALQDQNIQLEGLGDGIKLLNDALKDDCEK